MKILIDMNLSPDWVPALEQEGIEAVHWSEVGSPSAPDEEIFRYARQRYFVVFTHDLDFGDILAATGAISPSVIQVRVEDTAPESLITLFLSSIRQFRSHLNKGALITIDPERARARILPISDED